MTQWPLTSQLVANFPHIQTYSIIPHTFINLIQYYNFRPLKSFIYLTLYPIIPWPPKPLYWTPGLLLHNLNLGSEVPLTFYDRKLADR